MRTSHTVNVVVTMVTVEFCMFSHVTYTVYAYLEIKPSPVGCSGIMWSANDCSSRKNNSE